MADTPPPSEAGTPPDSCPSAVTWNAGDLSCGELILELRARVSRLLPGQQLHLTATDSSAQLDIKAWCRVTGHRLLEAAPPHYVLLRKEHCG